MSNMTFLQFRNVATMAGVEAMTFTAKPQQIVTLRGKGIEVSGSWSNDEDFGDACMRALRQFSTVLRGWNLRNPAERGDA